MPRKKRVRVKRFDGTCFACPRHGEIGLDVMSITGFDGRGEEEVFLFCGREDCDLPVTLVSRAPTATMHGFQWNGPGRAADAEDGDDTSEAA
jgi:hypothetical protein